MLLQAKQMKSAKDLIEEVRNIADTCSPVIAKMLNDLVVELEHLLLADHSAYLLACTCIGCNAASVEISSQDDSELWYLVTGLQNDYGQQDEVNEAIKYLDSRGLIKWDSTKTVCAFLSN